MNLRLARKEDAEALAGLCVQMGYPSSPEQVAVRLADLHARPDNAVFVAEVEGSLAGWVSVVICPTLESDRCAEVSGLVVDEGTRGRGVGAALMARAEAWARERSLSEVRVRSNVVREETHRFYRNLGYAIVKSQFTFSKKLAD